MFRPAALALSVVLIAGCTNTQSAYEGNDYSKAASLRMNVAAVLVDSGFTSSGVAPNVEQNLVPQPQDVLRTALAAHYVATRPNVAGAQTLRFTIKDASVVETQLSQPSDTVSQLLSEKPDYRYLGRVEVESKTEGVSRQNGFVHAEATRSLDVANATAEKRAELVQGMVRQMVDDVIAQLDQQIDANMGGYVLSGADMTIMPETSGRWDHVYEDRVSRSAGMRVITSK